jgi:hypothetical protein
MTATNAQTWHVFLHRSTAKESITMADIVSELAGRVGITPEQARLGLGIILVLAKAKLPADTFAKVQAVVPGADDMMAAVQSGPGASSGGILGSIAGIAGKILGGQGGGAAALAGPLAQLGLSEEQVQKFLPAAADLLKGRLPDDVMKQVGGLLPAPAGAPS